jgi:hypothetical protein
LAKDISKMSKAELESQIKRLKDMGEDESAQKYIDQLNKLSGKSGASVSGGVTSDDWDSAGSKFPKAGLHLAEFYAGEWKNVNQSVKLHYVLSGEDDEDKGKEGDLYPGVSVKGIWQFKNACKALGVEPIFKNGVLDVTAMLPKFEGKTGMVQYVLEQDKRPASEGGTGKSYPKAAGIFPIGAEVEEAPY